MSAPDTSTAGLADLCAEIKSLIHDGYADSAGVSTRTGHHRRTLSTLRALVAERDTAVEHADLTWFWAIVDRDGLTGVVSDERAALSHLVAASAERDTLKVAVAVARTQRDAARAEVAALREALGKIADCTFIDVPASAPWTASTFARAALKGPPA